MLGVGQRRDAPLGFIDAVIEHGANDARVEGVGCAGNIGGFARIEASAHSDVGLNLFHAVQFDVADEFGMFLIRAADQFAPYTSVACIDERQSARLAHGADELDGEFIGHVDHVQEDAFAFLEIDRIADQKLRQFRETRIVHILMQGKHTRRGRANQTNWRVASKNGVLTS